MNRQSQRRPSVKTYQLEATFFKPITCYTGGTLDKTEVINTNINRYQPKKTDLLINCLTRNEVAKKLNISRMTLLRYDDLLTTTIPAYRTERLGTGQPLTFYQIWVMTKLKQLIHRGIKGKALRQHLMNNSEQLNYEAYYESLRIS